MKYLIRYSHFLYLLFSFSTLPPIMICHVMILVHDTSRHDTSIWHIMIVYDTSIWHGWSIFVLVLIYEYDPISLGLPWIFPRCLLFEIVRVVEISGIILRSVIQQFVASFLNSSEWYYWMTNCYKTSRIYLNFFFFASFNTPLLRCTRHIKTRFLAMFAVAYPHQWRQWRQSSALD